MEYVYNNTIPTGQIKFADIFKSKVQKTKILGTYENPSRLKFSQLDYAEVSAGVNIEFSSFGREKSDINECQKYQIIIENNVFINSVQYLRSCSQGTRELKFAIGTRVKDLDLTDEFQASSAKQLFHMEKIDRAPIIFQGDSLSFNGKSCAIKEHEATITTTEDLLKLCH
jgi:hypothetical protein